LHSINKKEIKHPNTTKTNACPSGQHTLILFQRSLVVQILERATFFCDLGLFTGFVVFH
jgi:hypothetical protein